MKKASIIGIIIIIFLGSAYGLVGNYFYNFALNVDKEKQFLEDNPHLEETEAVSASIAEENELADAEFLANHQPISTNVVSSDNLNLNGNVFENKPSTNNKWAVVVHGYNSNSTHMIRYVRNFHQEGYNVLTPDLRGHGESEGDYIGMGWDDRLDLLLWINQIIEKDPDAEIVLFGVSMGAATVMMASGEELPSNVKVIVEDCGYSTVIDEFAYQLDDLFNLPEFPVLNAANTVTKIRAGYDLYEASSVKQVEKSTTPMLFIHGDSDTFVPYTMLEVVYNAANVEKDQLIIPGAGHGEAEKVDPETYWNKVWGFVNQYIK